MTARFEGKILRSTDKRPINFLSPRHRNHVDFRDPDCPLHRIYVFVSINVYIYYIYQSIFKKTSILYPFSHTSFHRFIFLVPFCQLCLILWSQKELRKARGSQVRSSKRWPAKAIEENSDASNDGLRCVKSLPFCFPKKHPTI